MSACEHLGDRGDHTEARAVFPVERREPTDSLLVQFETRHRSRGSEMGTVTISEVSDRFRLDSVRGNGDCPHFRSLIRMAGFQTEPVPPIRRDHGAGVRRIVRALAQMADHRRHRHPVAPSVGSWGGLTARHGGA
jgi:hypothetical protein